MVESLQMFLFLFKSKYRRKWSWFSPFLCSVLIVLLFCDGAHSKCSEENCLNGVCNNETCVCFEGWQGPECQYCAGKVKWVQWGLRPKNLTLLEQWPIWQIVLMFSLEKSVRLSNYTLWLLFLCLFTHNKTLCTRYTHSFYSLMFTGCVFRKFWPAFEKYSYKTVKCLIFDKSCHLCTLRTLTHSS